MRSLVKEDGGWVFQPEHSGKLATCCNVMTQYSSSANERSLCSRGESFPDMHSVVEWHGFPGITSAVQGAGNTVDDSGMIRARSAI